MDRCCANCGKVSGCGCSEAKFTSLESLDGTFFQSLIPIVDSARNIQACLGLRSYKVVLVWTRWSGARRGEGVEALVREHEILPIPKVSEMGVIGSSATPIGSTEEGSITVSEISARYTEDVLDGGKLADNEDFYYEIRVPGARRRRFFPAAAPSLSSEQVAWSIRLIRAYEDRTNDGNLPPG